MKKVIINALCKSDTRTPNMVRVPQDEYFNVYLKNSFVSLVSAKRNNSDSDVALIVNFEISKEWHERFKKNNIKIFKTEFKNFLVNKSTKWKGAYFKLEAINYILETQKYEKILLVDTDTIFMKSSNEIFEEAEKYILLYDVHYPLYYPNMIKSNQNYRLITDKKSNYIHYGGELICGNKKNLIDFIALCKVVVNKINELEEYIEDFGDEQIISVAADFYKGKIKTANAYIGRCWNTIKYRNIPSGYKNLSILHVPSEKEKGLIKLYNLISDNKYPNNNKIYYLLNMKNSLCNIISLLLRSIKKYR